MLHLEDLSLEPRVVIEILGPLLTAARKEKIDRVVSRRCHSLVTVLEDIYDRGNASAVMRSCEALGFHEMHLIQPGTRFKQANRVTQGADKWLEVQQWKSTRDCIVHLKERGFRICVTDLEGARPIDEIDFTNPVAMVFGNEKEGASREMLDLSDDRVLIPMQGFTQSFNISVAAAITYYHVYQSRVQKLGQNGDLSEGQCEHLRASYYAKTLTSAAKILRRHIVS